MNKEKKYIIFGIVMIVVLLIGFTYAFYQSEMNSNNSKVTVDTDDMRIIFTNGEAIEASDVYAEDNLDIVKTFSVENKTSKEYKYNIVFEDLVNTFKTTGYLVYKITSTDGGYNMTEFEDIPKSLTATNTVLAYSVSIPAKSIQNYTIEIKYINSETENQDDDQGAKLSGKLYISKGTIQSCKLTDAILRDNPTIEERTDFSVTNVANTTGTIYKTNKTEDGSDVYYYSGNTTNNWVLFGGFYWRIIRTNEDGSVRVLYSGTSPDTTQGYIGTSVYNSYSGYDESSYLGYMYSIDNSSGAGTSLDGMRGNSSSSTVKTFIDNWYKDNIFTNYDKYISKNAVYCNDRSTNSFSNFMATSFGAYNRLVSKKSPSYKCGVDENNSFIESTQAVADKFSVSTDGGGNGQLTYPVALMTADEVAFAGTVYDTQFSNKFAWYSVNMSGQSITLEKAWWTMSPCRWDGPTIWSQVPGTIYSVFGSKNNTVGYLYYDTVDTENVIRPVISIDKCAYVASGDGTPDNPYTIDETSCS